MSNSQHWNTIYQTKRPRELSWFAPHLDRSIALITAAASDTDAHIIDIGAGESTLADDLLSRGYRNISLLDISDAALKATQARLEGCAAHIHWYVGDVTSVALPQRQFDVWHDRAVFHFLIEPNERAAYVTQARKALKSGGHLIVATFAPDGPNKCSGLPVMRYSAAQLQREFGDEFFLVEHHEEVHHTPAGTPQKFVYCHCRRA